MLGREDGFDAIAVLDSFHLVLVIFSPSSEVCGSEDNYDSLMCGLLSYIFACPCGPRFKAVFTLRGRLHGAFFMSDKPFVASVKTFVAEACPPMSHTSASNGLSDIGRT
jgi:hypothetical protein